jgi:alpha-L-rhamnosidase
MNRNSRTSGTITALALLLLFTTNVLAQKISVKDFTVEHLVNPFSIDNPKPRFSWKIISDLKIPNSAATKSDWVRQQILIKFYGKRR